MAAVAAPPASVAGPSGMYHLSRVRDECEARRLSGFCLVDRELKQAGGEQYMRGGLGMGLDGVCRQKAEHIGRAGC
jgi:hypothetical protein